jgi:hypothetical protein
MLPVMLPGDTRPTCCCCRASRPAAEAKGGSGAAVQPEETAASSGAEQAAVQGAGQQAAQPPEEAAALADRLVSGCSYVPLGATPLAGSLALLVEGFRGRLELEFCTSPVGSF